jgi:hypothetical protein
MLGAVGRKRCGVARFWVDGGEVGLRPYVAGARGTGRGLEGGLGWWRVCGRGVRAGAGEGRAEVWREGAYVGGHITSI